MKKILKNSALLFLLTTIFIFSIPQLALSTNFEYIVAFGDSISDNGFDDGYGFKRPSNGKIWVEYLGEMLGDSVVESRAWSGAMSGEGNYSKAAKDWSGLLWQVTNYAPTTSTQKTLYTVEIGINDLHDPSNGIAPAQVVDNILKTMDILVNKGAIHIMVWNIPSSITFPGYIDKKYEWISYYEPLREKAVEAFSGYNKLIENAISSFAKKHVEVKLYFFDFNSAMHKIKDKFENTTTPWYGSYLYPQAGKWMWWDHWHFMTETHKYLAEEAYQVLK